MYKFVMKPVFLSVLFYLITHLHIDCRVFITCGWRFSGPISHYWSIVCPSPALRDAGSTLRRALRCRASSVIIQKLYWIRVLSFFIIRQTTLETITSPLNTTWHFGLNKHFKVDMKWAFYRGLSSLLHSLFNQLNINCCLF